MEFDADRFYNVRHAIVYIYTHMCLYTYVPIYLDRDLIHQRDSKWEGCDARWSVYRNVIQNSF